MADRLRLAVCGLVLTWCSLAAGCLLPYAYPNLRHVPGVSLDPGEAGEVRAFRVEVDLDIVDIGGSQELTLAPVPLAGSGRVPGQTELSVDHGYFVLGIALNYPVHHGHHTRVRLYRPGYQVVELAPGLVPDRVEWKPTADLAAQENALDSLLAPAYLQGAFLVRREKPDAPGWHPGCLKSGSASAPHRQVLLFAASEYEQLATRAAGKQKEQLSSKAAELRQKAAE